MTKQHVLLSLLQLVELYRMTMISTTVQDTLSVMYFFYLFVSTVGINDETRKDLAVRKNTTNIRKLNKVTIFSVAKRYALQAYGKTKICVFWTKDNCAKGDKCSYMYAHGEHELARRLLTGVSPAIQYSTDKAPHSNRIWILIIVFSLMLVPVLIEL